jgi:hypothetical protein
MILNWKITKLLLGNNKLKLKLYLLGRLIKSKKEKK